MAAGLLAFILIALIPDDLHAGDVFREVTFQFGASPAEHFAELDPRATFKFVGEHAWGAKMPRQVPRTIQLDLG
jgi:hypothetical protein